MYFNANNAILLHVRSTLESLTNKKRLKQWKDELNELLTIFGSELEMEVINTLIDIIDWNNFLAQNTNNDKIRSQHLGDCLKKFSEKEEFIEYFSTAVERSNNNKVFLKNLDTTLRILSADIETELIIGLALSISDSSSIKKKGLEFFKKKLIEFLENGKLKSLPKFFVVRALQFAILSREFQTNSEELKFLIESSPQVFKEPIFRNLAMTNNPSIRVEEPRVIVDWKSIMGEVKPCLSELIREYGPQITANPDVMKKMIHDSDKIDSKEVLKCLIVISEDFEENEIEFRKIHSKLIRTCYDSTRDSKLNEISTNSLESKQSLTWNRENMIKQLSSNIKINWVRVFNQLDSNDIIIKSAKTFTNLFKIFNFVKIQFKVPFPSEILFGRWKNIRSQVFFLQSLFSIGKPEMVFLHEMNPRKTKIDFQPNFKNNQKMSPGKMEIWSCLDLVERLIELSDTPYFMRIKKIFDSVVDKCPDILLSTLSQIKPSKGGPLFDEVFSQLFPEYFKNYGSSNSMIDSIWKHNPLLLTKALCQIYNSGKNSITLSKILDITLNIKSSLVKILNFENFPFTISLAILAAKRDFLHLDKWIPERVLTYEDKFIKAMTDYLENNLMVFLRGKEKSQAKGILESSHLTKNSLALIFDNIIADKNLTSKIAEPVVKKVAEIYNELIKYFPDFSKLKSEETEKEANELLTKYYDKKITIDEFSRILQGYKNSNKNKEHEIFSCIIHNLLVEYEHYHKFPEEYVKMTGRVFGHIIKMNLVGDFVFLKVCLEFICDSLKKQGKIHLLGSTAFDDFKDSIHENLEVCKYLFDKEWLRKNYYEDLYQIWLRMKAQNNAANLNMDHIQEILLRNDVNPSKISISGGGKKKPIQPKIKKKEVAKVVEKKLKNININVQELEEEITENVLEKATAEVPIPQIFPESKEKVKSKKFDFDIEKVETLLLAQEFKRIYEHESKNIEINQDMKKRITFTLNNLDEGRLDKTAKDLQKNLKGDKNKFWLAITFVWDRIPTESQYLNLYSSLLKKVGSRPMLKRVMKETYRLVNLCIDFALYKNKLTPEERKMVRNCGNWLGVITIGSNKPILKKNLDIKYRLFEALEMRKSSKIIPIICSILKSVKMSRLFKKKNPYIMAIMSALTEIMDDKSVKQITAASINALLSELNINRTKDITYFGYIKTKKSAKQSKNKLFVNCLPNYIVIDSKTLEPYLAQMEIDLRQLVAVAVDLAVKEITKPVLQRSVNIALFTTKELVLKDFGLEPDENKLLHATRIMVTNLAGNLALVTCREPLRVHIRDNLEALLDAQTNLDSKSKDTIKEIASLDNLELACAIVKKFVIDKALDEVNRDQTIIAAVEVRKRFKERGERYFDENIYNIQRMLPQGLRPEGNNFVSRIDIYENFSTDNAMFNNMELGTNGTANNQKIQQRYYNNQYYGGNRMVDQNYYENEFQGNNNQIELDKNKISAILGQLEKEIENPNTEEKVRAIHMIYGNLSKLLQSYKNVEKYIFTLAKMVLTNLFNGNLTMDKLRYYSDVLVIYSNYNPQLPRDITSWIFKVDKKKRYVHQIFIVFLRRNLLHLLDFDRMYGESLKKVKQNFLTPLICIVQVLKNLVIEEKIFTIYTFKQIVDKITGFYKSAIYNHLTPEVTIFIENLIQYKRSSNDYITSIKFRLTNLEPEYKKLMNDVEDYFTSPDPKFYKLSVKFLKKWLDAQKEKEMGEFIKSFEDEITRNGDKTTICFFCYIFDISCRKATQNSGISKTIGKSLKLDYTYIDLVSKMITILLKTLINYDVTNKTNLLEKILTAVIIVLTKEHHYNSHNFNQKPFFKLLFNILYDLNRKEYAFGENIQSMLLTIVQTLHILQPIKYPGFAYSWLQLVSSKFLMAPLLKERELWAQFKTLILDLIIFYKEVFTVKSLNTPEMKMFYKGTLRLLLVLLHDFPDFLCDFSFCLLEEIPEFFMQVKNIIVSAYPKGMRIPDPFDAENFGRIELNEEYNNMPLINPKIEERINSHNLHNLIMNCIKNPDQNDFETIKSSFYVSGYKGDTQINRSLLNSFVLYVPYFIYSSKQINSISDLDSTKYHTIFNNYKQDSYMLFVKLIKESDYELRDAIINSILNNIRYPNQISFYFTKLILIIFSEVDHDDIHEQITRNLFERLIIEKPHPWGILSLLYKLLTDNKYTIENKDFYQEKLGLMEQLIKYVFKFVRISDVATNEDASRTNSHN